MINIFGNREKGAMLNMIRCDKTNYLVWKWRPEDGNLNRENAVRMGSSLRVKDGEVAVFVYKQSNGISEEFIYGPYDGIIQTKNFPILADIIAKFYGGGTPFQADVYFINLAQVVQLRFGIPYTNVSDPRYPDFVVPVSGGGMLTFKISDPREFIKKHRMVEMTPERLQEQIRQMVERHGKRCIANATYIHQLPLNQIERVLDFVSEDMRTAIDSEIKDFGIELVRWDLNRIDADETSEGWLKLMQITRGRQEQVLTTQTEMEIQNLREMQAMNAENMRESMRIQREELQRAQRLQTEQTYIGAHALNRQSDVLMTGMENIGQMTAMNGDASGAGLGMNPMGMMTGMMMGGAMGQQLSQMMQQMNPAMAGTYTPPPAPGAGTPPPPPQSVTFMIAENGNQAGPFTLPELSQLIAAGRFSPQTYVWRQGMTNWEQAANVPETAQLFNPGAGTVPPPLPPNP